MLSLFLQMQPLAQHPLHLKGVLPGQESLIDIHKGEKSTSDVYLPWVDMGDDVIEGNESQHCKMPAREHHCNYLCNCDAV